MKPVLFAHGLEGSPEGRKPTAMRAADFDVHAPDGRKRGLADRVAALHAALETLDAPVLVGSSYGGLAMLAVARDTSRRFSGLVLLAPALIWTEDPAGDPELLVAPPGTVVIHGTEDKVIPLAASERLIARSPDTLLITPADGHRLANSLEILVAEVGQIAGRR